jgi:hypothetical protein
VRINILRCAGCPISRVFSEKWGLPTHLSKPRTTTATSTQFPVLAAERSVWDPTHRQCPLKITSKIFVPARSPPKATTLSPLPENFTPLSDPISRAFEPWSSPTSCPRRIRPPTSLQTNRYHRNPRKPRCTISRLLGGAPFLASLARSGVFAGCPISRAFCEKWGLAK